MRRVLLLIVSFLWALPSLAEVTPNGAFQQEIEIKLPPATGKAQPQLALRYNSNASNGIVGWGWDLAGLGAISRINAGRGIRYDGQDTYAANGAKLLDVSNNSTTFHTVNESWGKYVPSYGVCNAPANEPCSWVLYGKDGLKYYFGQTEDSRVEAIGRSNAVRTWLLNKVEDAHGSYYEISYEEFSDKGAAYPKQIVYTKGNGLSTFKTVDFTYETRTDQIVRYDQRAKEEIDQRMSKISVSANGQAIRSYHLDYLEEKGPSRLAKVQEYGSDGLSALPPIQFEWSTSNEGFANPTQWITAMRWNYNGHNFVEHVGDCSGNTCIYSAFRDMNADGLPDKVMHYANDQLGLWVALNNGNGFEEPTIWIEDNRWQYMHHAKVSFYHTSWIYNDLRDINGDSLPDKIMHLVNGDYGFWVALNTGTGFAEPVEWMDKVAWGHDRNNTISHRSTYDIYDDLRDVTGDGLPDKLLHHTYATPGFWVAVNNGAGFEDPVAWVTDQQWGNTIHNYTRQGDASFIHSDLMDMNNDGLPDKIMDNAFSENAFWVALNTGSGFEDPVKWLEYNQWENDQIHRVRHADATWKYNDLKDMNGDNLPDKVMDRAYGENGLWVALNTGTGFEAPVKWIRYSQWQSTEHHYLAHYASNQTYDDLRDVNGDGLPDKLMYIAYGEQASWVALNTGTGFEDPVKWGRPEQWNYHHNNKVMHIGGPTIYSDLLDINGDGFPDKVMHHALNSSSMWVALNQQVRPSIVAMVSPLGGRTEIAYTPSLRLEGAAMGTTNTCGNGEGDLCGNPNLTARNLVTQVKLDNGRQFEGVEGADDTILQYSYTNGRIFPGNPQDTTDLGFESMTTTHLQTGLVSKLEFRQDKPFQGAVALKKRVDGNGSLLEKVTFAYDAVNHSSGTQSTRLTQNVKETFDNSTLVHTVTDDFLYDEWDFQTSATHCEGTDCRTLSQAYEHDLDQWQLGRIVETKTVSAGAIWDWKKYDYVGQNLSLQQQFLCADAAASCLAEDNGSFIQISRGNDFDVFGNPLVSYDALDRIQTFSYDPTYQNVVVETKDALGMTIKSDYDVSGNLLSRTNANGQTVTNEYDAFGRWIKTNTANGGWARRSFHNQGDPNQQYIRIETLEDTHISWEQRYLDGLGSEYLLEKKANVGQEILTDQMTFFKNGVKVKKKSEPHYRGEVVLWETKTFDKAGRISRIDLPDGSSTHYTYSGADTTYAVNEITSTQTRDGRNRLIQLKENSGQTLSYQYDPLDRLTQIQRSDGYVLAMSYNTLGQRVSLSDSARGENTFAFDAHGNLTSKTSPSGKVTSYQYDVLNRMVQKTPPNTNATTYTYDNTAFKNNMGRLSTVNYPGGSTSYAYDLSGRISSESQTIDGVSGNFVTTYERDKKNRPIRTIFPDGSIEEITYSADGNVYQVSLNGVVYGTFSRYSATGKLQHYATNTGFSDYETQTQYAYNLNDVLQNVEVQGPEGNILRDSNFNHDAQGNITSITDKRLNKVIDGVNTSESQNFLYDSANRLTQAQGAYDTKGYAYDSQGNVTQFGGVQDQVLSYTKQLLTGSSASGFAATYDADGNMTSKTQDGKLWAYFYDGENRLIQVNLDGTPKTKFVYNHRGIRIKKIHYRDGGRSVSTYYLGNYELRQDTSDNFHTTTIHLEVPSFGKLATVTKPVQGVLAVAGGATAHRYDANLSLFNGSSVAGATQIAFYGLMGRTVALQHEALALWSHSNRSPIIWTVALMVFAYWSWKASKYLSRQSRFSPRLRMGAIGMVSVFTMVACQADESKDKSKSSAPQESYNQGSSTTPNSFDLPPLYDAENEVPYYGSLARVMGSTTEIMPVGTWFYHPNHIGSSTLITDGRGEEATRILYLPFGEIDQDHSTGTNVINHKFTGQELDEETGLMYYKSRYYDPSVGRFLTPDNVIPGNGLEIQGLNRYAYVGNNPIVYEDPTGHRRCGWNIVCHGRSAMDDGWERAKREHERAKKAIEKKAREDAAMVRDRIETDGKNAAREIQVGIVGVRREIGNFSRASAREATNGAKATHKEVDKIAPDSILSNSFGYAADTVERNEEGIASESEAMIYVGIDLFTFGMGSTVILNMHDPNDDVPTGQQNGTFHYKNNKGERRNVSLIGTYTTVKGAYGKALDLYNFSF